LVAKHDIQNFVYIFGHVNFAHFINFLENNEFLRIFRQGYVSQLRFFAKYRVFEPFSVKDTSAK